VFISVTTVPAAADIAAGTATGQFGTAAGAAAQLGINVLCIVVAAVLTLQVQHRLWKPVLQRHPATRADRAIEPGPE